MNKAYALGLDPGFENLGAAVRDIGSGEVLALRLLQTHKAKQITTTDDNVRRALWFAEALGELFIEFPHIQLICSESMSYPRNASTIAKQSILWGVVIGLSYEKKIPLLHYLPKELKRLVAGTRTASKDDIISALSRLFAPQDLSKLHGSVPPSGLNHMYDALGSIVACQNLIEYSLLKAKVK